MESAGRRHHANIKLPTPRSGHVAVTYGGFMLVWGGYSVLPEFGSASEESNDQYLNGKELWCYNIDAQIWDLWHTKNSPPGMSGSCAVCVNHHMYVFAGFNGNGNSNKLYRLNLKTRTWTHLNPGGCRAPSPRDKLTCWPYQDKLVFFGGYGPPPVNEDSPAIAVSWKDWHPDPASRRYWAEDILLRGWNNEVFVYNIIHNSWSKVDVKINVPCPRAAHATAVLGSRGYLFGGRFEGSRLSDVHYLDLDTMQWSGSLPVEGDIPIGRSWHSMTAVSDRHLIVYGGYSTDGDPLDDVWVLDTDSLTWQQQRSHPTETRTWHTAVRGMDVGETIIFGGCANNLLDHRRSSIHSRKIISFFFSPQNLSRLCTNAVQRDIDVLRDDLSSLPVILQRRIEIRLQGQQTEQNYNLRSRSQSLLRSLIAWIVPQPDIT